MGSVAVASGLNVPVVSAEPPPPGHRSHVVMLTGSSNTYPSYVASANLATNYAVTTIASDTAWQATDIYSLSYGSPVPSAVKTGLAYSSTAGGWAMCDVPGSGGRCNHYAVYYNPDYWQSTQLLSDNFWRALGCHEIIHTVGVGERSASSCLYGYYFSNNYNLSTARHPNSTEIVQINGIYATTPA